MAGLYFHIPFCRKACNYCDFHFSTLLNDKERVINAMLLELEQRKNYLNTDILSSVYFGGGTPSVLEPKELEKVMLHARNYFTWKQKAEVTLEINPEDVNQEALRNWKSLGFNRLSLGVQSFNNEELKWMKRSHTAEQSIQAVHLAQKAGFTNISIDLIYGSKFQDLSSWSETLDQAILLDSTHISVYNLTIENKTELGVKYQKGTEPGVDESLSVAQFLRMRKKLLNAGFLHYEISNFAKAGHESKHNSSYWNQQNYLGIGPSAHSFDQHSRQWNFSNNARYCKALEAGEIHFEKEILGKKERYNEYVLTGLRTTKGCDVVYILNEFGESCRAYFEEEAAKRPSFFDVKSGIYRLNERGMLKADAIASDLFML